MRTKARLLYMLIISFQRLKVVQMILVTFKHFVRPVTPINVQKMILTLEASSTATNIEIQNVYFVLTALGGS